MDKKYFLLIILLIISINSAEALIPLNGFWKKRGPALKFSTVAQSVYASNCSAIVTVQTNNSSGVATNVASSLAINLSATGSVVFYSDSGCTSSITSITVATATNNKSFYFISSATGNPNLTAAATGYVPASQIETVSANPFIWLGGGGNANWNTAANWSGGAAPGASNIALFDVSCSSNCSPTINANISVGGIRINSGYSGTVTQASGVTVTLAASSGYVQLDGSYVGSNSSITDNGIFTLGGGIFTSTTGILKVLKHWTILNAPTFNHNNGTLTLYNNPLNITPGSLTYFNVIFSGDDGTFDLGGGTMNIAGTLTLDEINGNRNGYHQFGISNGTLSVSGTAINATNFGQAGNALIKLVGNASGQTITGVSTARFPNLEIAAGANAVTISGSLSLYANYTFTSASSLTTTGSSIVFNSGYNMTSSIIPGAVTYNNISFEDDDGNYDLGGGTLNIAGTLTLNGTNGNIASRHDYGVNNGTLSVSGTAINSLNIGQAGSALLKLVGNASGQTITGVSTARFPKLEIAAGANAVTLSGTLLLYGNYTLTTASSLTTTGSTIIFNAAYGTTKSIIPGPATYNNIRFEDDDGNYDLGGGTFPIAGTLTLNGTNGNVAGNNAYGLNNGTVDLSGNLVSSNIGQAGACLLLFSGTANQTITISGASARIPIGNVTVNKASGSLSLASNVSWNSTGQTLTVTTGSMDMAGHNLTAKALSLNSTTITKNTGVLIVNGTTVSTGALYGGTIDP